MLALWEFEYNAGGLLWTIRTIPLHDSYHVACCMCTCVCVFHRSVSRLLFLRALASEISDINSVWFWCRYAVLSLVYIAAHWQTLLKQTQPRRQVHWLSLQAWHSVAVQFYSQRHRRTATWRCSAIYQRQIHQQCHNLNNTNWTNKQTHNYNKGATPKW